MNTRLVSLPRAILLLALAVGVLVAAAAPAAEPAPPPAACHVVIVGGLPGSPVFARRFDDWTSRFRAWCVEKAGVPPTNIVMLGGPSPTPATESAVLAVLADTAGRATPADQLVLFIVGHGDTADGEAALALAEHNLRVSVLRDALDRIPARRQTILHLAAASGDAAAALSATGRVIVTATAPGEIAEPVFPEFFLQALERSPAAPPPTILAAYQRATNETARWIRRLSQTDSGAWRVDGKESIAVFRKLCDGPADAAGARSLDPASRPLETEPDVPLETPADKTAAEKLGIPPRIRIVNEHATLDDPDGGAAAALVPGK
jgi:hypothetical protein